MLTYDKTFQLLPVKQKSNPSLHFPDLSVFSCHFFSLFLFLLSQRLTKTQLELCGAKNGTAAFCKWQKFVSYLAQMNSAWEQEEEGSCGGMIWYDLKLFPNRLHGVWSYPLISWWIISTTGVKSALCHFSSYSLLSFLPHASNVGYCI